MGSLHNTVVKFSHILEKSAEIPAPTKVQRFRRSKLRIWTPEISTALTQKKASFREWKLRGRPQDITDPLLVDMKEASKRFRRACRVECAKQRFDMRQEILGARSENVTLFHKLINKQRGRSSNCIDWLHVGDSVFKTDSGILNG